MPLKAVKIRFEEPPVPFDAGSEILSYIAYPVEEEKRAEFAGLLCRWEHFYRLRIDPQWGVTPHPVRPERFESLGGIDAYELHHGMERIRRRLTTAASILLPFLLAYTTSKKIKKIGDLTATVDHICQKIIEQEGGDAASNLSNFKTRQWSPTSAHFSYK
jgi:hypothetical protein